MAVLKLNMDYPWISIFFHIFLTSRLYVNGSQHPSECDVLRRNVIRADSNSRTLDPAVHLSGQWVSQSCEIRSGPVYVLRHYKFYSRPKQSSHSPLLKFKLRHYYYSDASCSQPLYGLNIHGSYRMGPKSWAVPDASQMNYEFNKISVVGYSQEMVNELQHIINESCSGYLHSWVPYKQYRIYRSPLETDSLFSGATGPSVESRKNPCLSNVYQMFQDLDLLKIVHRPLNAFDSYDRTKLYLGDLHSRIQQRKSHVPTAFQVPLVKSNTIQGCDVCKSVLGSSDTSPPKLNKLDNLPLYLDGEWISGECEVQPLGIFIKRSLYVTLNNFTYEQNVYAESTCTSLTMSVKYYGEFNVRALSNLAGRSTSVENKGEHKNPIKPHLNVLPVVEMFANTQELLSRNSLMRQSKIHPNNELKEKVYETVDTENESNDEDNSEEDGKSRHENDEDIVDVIGNGLKNRESSSDRGGEQFYQVLSEIEADRWPRLINRLENNGAQNRRPENSKEINKHNEETKRYGNLYDQLENKLDVEAPKEVFDNLLERKSHIRHKRHVRKHGRKDHTKNEDQILNNEKSANEDSPTRVEIPIPAEVLPEILPNMWDRKRVETLFPNVKINQMNAVHKKDLEKIFVRQVHNDDEASELSKQEKLSSRIETDLNTKYFEEPGYFPKIPQRSNSEDSLEHKNQQEKHYHHKRRNEKQMNMPEKILYWYGKPNLGRVPVVEKIEGESVFETPYSVKYFEKQTGKHAEAKVSVHQSQTEKSETDLGDKGKSTVVPNDESSPENNNEYHVEFHIQAADLKLYDYDLIENLKYDQKCAARYQLWGTIIGDTIPLRYSCESIGIQLPHTEHNIAKLQLTKTRKYQLYLEQPDTSSGPNQEDSLSSYNRIVNYQALPLQKCKLYQENFYFDDKDDIEELDDTNKKVNEIGKEDGGLKMVQKKTFTKIVDEDDEDEDGDGFEDFPTEVLVAGDYVESKACDISGIKTAVIVSICIGLLLVR
ncbi:hypothetical protein WDU94_006537 [Cyamophila willieti]